MQLSYTFRNASPTHIPVLHQLATAVWEPTYRSILSPEQIDYMFGVIYTHEALERQMQDGQTFVLLYLRETPVGFAAYSVKDAAALVCKLNKLYLLPDRQGGGLGKLLLQEIERRTSQLGARHLDLNVNKYNKARAFYERCGYTVLLEEDIPIGPYWMNDYVMRKALP